MSNQPVERLLLIVAVEQTKVEAQASLQGFITQMEKDKAHLIDRIRTTIRGEKVLAEKVNLLALDNYLHLFASVLEVDTTTIQSILDKNQSQQNEDPFVTALLGAIFPKLDANLTWTLLRVGELTADPMGAFSLLGMKGIGSR